jgi:SAM-dependent methyltransferase
MQAYSSSFAQVYNQRWASFARRIAPMIQAFYEGTPLGQEHRTLLDLCCGTGQLAAYFVEQDYRVVGIDLSEPMLGYARDNAASHVQSGAARFVQADASRFSLDDRFGLVVSTYAVAPDNWRLISSSRITGLSASTYQNRCLGTRKTTPPPMCKVAQRVLSRRTLLTLAWTSALGWWSLPMMP